MSQASAVAPEGYEVVRELGTGRCGRTVLCRKGGSSVVVRVLGVNGSASATLAAELRALAVATDHACAVGMSRVWIDPVLGVCVEHAYIPGDALGSLPGAAADASAVASGGVRLATALAHSHQRGVLHGDVCPANVLVDAEGRWVLANGGLAHALGRTGFEPIVELDPVFAPREMQGWETPAEPADVYSLGATLSAQLLRSTDSASFVSALTTEPSGLGALLIRMLAPNPADRPSLAEVDEVLRTYVPAAGRGVLPAAPVGPRPLPAPPRPKVRLAVTEPDAIVRSGRRRTVVAAAAIGAVFLAGASAVAVTNSGADEPAMNVAGTASPAEPNSSPTPTRTPNPTAIAASLQPQAVEAVPLYDAKQKVWRLAAIFSMQSVPEAVTGWKINALHPVTGERRGQRDLVAFQRPSPGKGMQYAYGLDPKVPFSSCVGVRTVVAGVASPEVRDCPDPAQVRRAEAGRAADLKAKQAEQTSPKPKKPARNT